MHWVSKDTHPYVSRETYRTRGWLLVRKVRRHEATTNTDRRVAMLLLGNTKYAQAEHVLRPELERIAYGSDHGPTSGDVGAPAEGMGSE